MTAGHGSAIIQSVSSQTEFTVSTNRNKSLLDLLHPTAPPLRRHTVRRIGSLFVRMIHVYT